MPIGPHTNYIMFGLLHISLLVSVPEYETKRLQHFQNAAICIVLQTPRWSSTAENLRELHRLPNTFVQSDDATRTKLCMASLLLILMIYYVFILLRDLRSRNAMVLTDIDSVISLLQYHFNGAPN